MARKPDLAIVPKDHSFKLKSEEDLLAAFSEKDQKRVLPPPGITYPINAQHYYAWRENSGNYVYMMFRKPHWRNPMGLVFKRPTSGGEHSAGHCDWCLSHGSSDQVSILGLNLNSKQSIGVILCTDLKCAARLEAAAELSGKSFERLMGDLYERIGKLFESVLRHNPGRENEVRTSQ